MPIPRRRKVALGCLAVLLLAALAFLVGARRFLVHRRYDVVSIAAAAEYKDEARLKRAFALPVAHSYQAGPIAFQTNGSVCGPTSLANVLRSSDHSGATADGVLEGSGKCPFGICFGGLTLDELGALAGRATARRVTVLRDLSREAFREHVARANDPARRYVLNFDRGPLFGTQGGHHSPIGGYLEGDDLVLVLDVNAKYGPWLVRTDRLFDAMDTVDEGSGKKRGLLLLE